MNYDIASKALRDEAKALELYAKGLPLADAARDAMLLRSGRLDGIGIVLVGIKDGKPASERA